MTKAGLRYILAIVRFLGYNPLPEAKGLGERLVRQRTSLGLSQKDSARCLGIDPGTLARWERGELEPTGAYAARALRFLEAAEPTWAPAAVRTSYGPETGSP